MVELLISLEVGREFSTGKFGDVDGSVVVVVVVLHVNGVAREPREEGREENVRGSYLQITVLVGARGMTCASVCARVYTRV